MVGWTHVSCRWGRGRADWWRPRRIPHKEPLEHCDCIVCGGRGFLCWGVGVAACGVCTLELSVGTPTCFSSVRLEKHVISLVMLCIPEGQTLLRRQGDFRQIIVVLP